MVENVQCSRFLPNSLKQVIRVNNAKLGEFWGFHRGIGRGFRSSGIRRCRIHIEVPYKITSYSFRPSTVKTMRSLENSGFHCPLTQCHAPNERNPRNVKVFLGVFAPLQSAHYNRPVSLSTRNNSNSAERILRNLKSHNRNKNCEITSITAKYRHKWLILHEEEVGQRGRYTDNATAWGYDSRQLQETHL
jgi:hypothetical protein